MCPRRGGLEGRGLRVCSLLRSYPHRRPRQSYWNRQRKVVHGDLQEDGPEWVSQRLCSLTRQRLKEKLLGKFTKFTQVFLLKKYQLSGKIPDL